MELTIPTGDTAQQVLAARPVIRTASYYGASVKWLEEIHVAGFDIPASGDTITRIRKMNSGEERWLW